MRAETCFAYSIGAPSFVSAATLFRLKEVAHSPSSSKDQAWPHEAVRLAIENLASDEVEQGLSIERFNMRGVYSKSIGEGGVQERGLAEQTKACANAMPSYPRTAAMLMGISDSWMSQAEQADASAERDTLRW